MAGSVGTAFVQIIPSMKGFRKTLAADVNGAGSEAGAGLSKTLGAAGTTAGNKLGASLKGAVSTSSQGIASATLASLTSSVKNAEAALGTAKRKAADDAGKVRVAEEKLNEVRAKGNASASQVAQAEERLAAAVRKAAESEAVAKAKADALTQAQHNLDKATADAAAEADNASGRFGKLGDMFASVKDKAGSGLSTALAGVGKAATAGIAAAGAAAVAVGKSAVSSYADFEQLQGGVAKLFGGGKMTADAQAVMANASNAFKTAGMSANQYMETVTGFSASLISSLGNDTAAAAKYADMAVVDMADNANTFGTDMEAIQNAYQGFAKGNYTMLDNLKLGYGGTKEEMQRLLDDASKISEVEYDIDNFADITEAIHVMQGEMKIAGATSAEASGTIEGSANAMKGAWANLLTSFGSGENVGGNMSAFVDSVSTYLGNLIPRVKEVAVNMMAALGGIIREKVPALAPVIDGIGNIFGKLSGAVKKIDLGKVFTALAKAGKAVAPVIKSLWTIFSSLVSITVNLAKALWPLVSLVGSVLVAAFKRIWAVISTVVSVVASVVSAFASMYAKVVGYVSGLYAKVVSAFNSVKAAVSAAVNSVVSVVAGIGGRVKGALASAGQWLIGAGKSIISGLISGISSMLGGVGSILAGIGGRVRGALAGAASWLVGIGASIVNGLKSGISSAIGGVASLFAGLGGRIRGALSGAASWLSGIGRQIVNGLINGIGDFSGRVLSKLKGSISGGIDKLKGWLGIHSPSRLMAAEVGAPIADGVALGVEKAAPGTVSAIGDALAGVEQLRYQIPVAATGAVSPVGGMTPNMGVAGGRTVYQTINVQAVDPAAVAAVIRAQERVALGA